ncbi:unnamed protein product [Caenorhabditis auriculariae]|uniref:Uncharacterized protein n=1 Tax=Caenorhabditis auriculariae TaxID=2777116 RepID=A0A8S1GX51_9PELO|nr:unnamed protein product [Caenorhabditis auriculariae]
MSKPQPRIIRVISSEINDPPPPEEPPREVNEDVHDGNDNPPEKSNFEPETAPEEIEEAQQDNEDRNPEDIPEDPQTSGPTRRRFSLPKIPAYPLEKKVQAGKSEIDPEKRKSINLDIYKDFRQSNDQKGYRYEDQIVHVECEGKFQTMKKGIFQIERMLEKEHREEMEKREMFVIPSRLHDIGSAYHLQRSFNNFSSIIQGFLAGLTLALAVFAFNFATEVDHYKPLKLRSRDLLTRGYRWMSMPIHAVFTFAFTLGLVTSIDRIGVYKMQHFLSYKLFWEALSDNSFIGIVLWSGGLFSTLMCIRFDEALSPVKEEAVLTPYLLLLWRVCSVSRAVCAALGWLLFAFRNDADLVSRHLKFAVIEDVKHSEGVTAESIAERRHLTLEALRMI